MERFVSYLKCAVAAFLIASPVAAQDDELEALFEGLKTADPAALMQIESRIYAIWSQTGSDSMDLLLARGREATEEGDLKKAIEHFSALIDHAPDFAEGYNARATVYFQQGRIGQALEDIRRTLALNPLHFNAMSGLALILEDMGQYEDALAAWREVERLHPNHEGVNASMPRLEFMVDGREL